MKILIVDDSTAMRMIVKKTLRLAGFEGHEISEVDDGAKALASIKASKPDLVLSDWNMPNMTGLQLLETLSGEGVKVTFGFIT
ncbi:MAG: response regulator, partial [Steroidobacteraceae bacterium]